MATNVYLDLKTKSVFYYHPQQSWGKEIFSEACVKNSVHGKGVVWPIACLDTPPRSRPLIGVDPS